MNGIYKIAVVEDDEECAASVSRLLTEYGEKKGCVFDLTEYESVETFLSDYSGRYDMVLMDIVMPGLNGMDGARRLRELDSAVVIVFLTGIAQFAVQGYEVGAMDYIMKPVNRRSFELKMDRVFSYIDRNDDRYIAISNKQETYRIDVRDILYIEVEGHHLFFHKTNGETLDACGKLYDFYGRLRDAGFACCNRCYLLNMRYINKIESDAVIMIDGTKLLISRGKRKSFLEEFVSFMSIGNREEA